MPKSYADRKRNVVTLALTDDERDILANLFHVAWMGRGQPLPSIPADLAEYLNARILKAKPR